MSTKPRLWPALRREVVAEVRQPRTLLATTLIPLAAATLWRIFEPAVPAPLALAAGALHTLMALSVGTVGGAVQMAVAVQSSRPRLAVLLPTRLALVGAALLALHLLARTLGMPPLPHPVSTTMALIVTALAATATGLLIGRLARTPARAAVTALAIAALAFAAQSLIPLSPAGWARLAVQTALTGTGTRAAASALIALATLALLALIATRLVPRRWPLALLAAGWLAMAAYVWQRPGPPLPAADMASVTLTPPLPADDGPIAPIATTVPDAALASALARVTRQIETWPPAADPDPLQRTRNLLLIAAVADLYDTEPLQSHLPRLVEAGLARRLPPAQIPILLAAVAADPALGSVTARETLPSLGLPASTGDEAPTRQRMALYALKLLARQPK